MRPFFEQLAELEQEHDRTGGAEVAADHRNADGNRIEHLHAQLTAQQALEAAAEEGRGHIDRADNLERGGQEERAGGLDGDHGHQLFLIFAVQRTAAVLRRERGHSRGLIVEACDGAEHIRAGTAVADSRAAGALVNDRRLDAQLAQQIGFEQVGLFEGHTILVHPYTQPSAAFVLNECFHDELPPLSQFRPILHQVRTYSTRIASSLSLAMRRHSCVKLPCSSRAVCATFAALFI